MTSSTSDILVFLATLITITLDCSRWIITANGDVKNKNSQKEKETSELLDPLPGPSTSRETVNQSPSPIAMDAKSQTKYGIDLQHADESSICASRATLASR